MSTVEPQVRRFSKGDTLRVLNAQLLNPDDTPVDLTSQSVKFNMTNVVTGVRKITSGSVSIVDILAGKVQYNWQAADVNEAAEYRGQFVRIQGTATEHFPVKEHILVIVFHDTV